jgi:hypothetical protein
MIRKLALLIVIAFSFQANAVDAQSTSSMTINAEHIQYWMKTLETHPLIIIRKQAARHLGALQSNMANPALIKCLSDANEDVRIQCAYSLGRLGDSSSLRPLYELIENSPSQQIKSAAKSAIDKINAHEEFARQRKQKLKEMELKNSTSSN